MMARGFVGLGLVASAMFGVVSGFGPGHVKPNIVFALTDDLGWNYPGYHNPEANTPTLDALAREGVRLDSHYTYKCVRVDLCSAACVAAALPGAGPRLRLQHVAAPAAPLLPRAAARRRGPGPGC